MNLPCRTCHTPRPPRMPLCPTCWALLPAATRRALDRRDNHARLRQLHHQLDAGVPLTEIQVTP